MRTIVIIISLMSLISACNDNGPTQPQYTAPVFVDFDSSLQGDSVIAYIDDYVIWRGTADSNLIHGASGLLVETRLGSHRLTIDLRLQYARGEVYFIATTENSVRITVHHDAGQRMINFIVEYLTWYPDQVVNFDSRKTSYDKQNNDIGSVWQK